MHSFAYVPLARSGLACTPRGCRQPTPSTHTLNLACRLVRARRTSLSAPSGRRAWLRWPSLSSPCLSRWASRGAGGGKGRGPQGCPGRCGRVRQPRACGLQSVWQGGWWGWRSTGTVGRAKGGRAQLGACCVDACPRRHAVCPPTHSHETHCPCRTDVPAPRAGGRLAQALSASCGGPWGRGCCGRERKGLQGVEGVAGPPDDHAVWMHACAVDGARR